MSRYAHDGRGRHKRAESPETIRWRKITERSEWLKPTPAPARPPWMDTDEYLALVALRRHL